ncbi:MAG TPA: desulfoferrodoxin family protein [Candidatus Binatia bacterium]|nr:desulfoferrodoxin family protein [Candidatus Binatia bacterium]
MKSTYKRVAWIIVAVGLAFGVFAAGEVTRPAWGGQEEQFTPEYKELRNSFDAKHTPKIVAPDSIKRGQWFDVTVSVGAGDDHPSLSEHFVRYIALYINTAEIARVYLHPVYSFPKVTFTIALDEGGMLRAIEEPTHSAAWEASKKITVVP